MAEPRRLIHIVGLQKSGTALLFRLLRGSGLADSPFGHEWQEFWGDIPPFTPRKFPTGAIYERHGGEAGHEAGASDATQEVRDYLYGRLAETASPVLVNKNPYNSVRLPWLRAMFPESTIIAMVRRPVDNVYSLLKKYEPHEQRGAAPEEGWWGVKPAGWRGLVEEDKVAQCAHQWSRVLGKLWADRENVDMFIRYQDLCAQPVEYLRKILGVDELAVDFGSIRCFDGEFAAGSRLRSKNRYFKEMGGLEVPETEPMEFPPLADEDVARIKAICGSVAERLGVDA